MHCGALPTTTLDRSHRESTEPVPADRAIWDISEFCRSSGLAPDADALPESLRQPTQLPPDRSMLKMDISSVYTCHRQPMTGQLRIGYG